MANLRLIYNNKLLGVNSSATDPTTNDFKSSTTTSNTFTIQCDPVVGLVALVFYLPEHTDTVQATVDSGTTYPDNSTTQYVLVGGLPIGYGGGKYYTIYLPNITTSKTTFTVVFTQQVKVSRVIVGNYWSPKYNFPYGIQVGFTDTSTYERLHSGDLYTTKGPRYKTMQFDLEYLDPTDKTIFFNILKSIGKAGYLFVSAFPEDADKNKEQMYSIYGKLSSLSDIVYSQYTRYTSSVEIEEF